MTSLSLPARAVSHGPRRALLDGTGAVSYAELLAASHRVASCLLAGTDDLREAPVAFLTPPDRSYVAAQWGIWQAGGVAVPLAPGHPLPEITYVLDDLTPAAVVVHPDYADVLRPVAEQRGLRVVVTQKARETAPGPLPPVAPHRRAMILYTSGTTSRPKGVVTTHRALRAMIETLVDAWGWTADDRILLVLPLHHTHGIVNVLLCALWSGAVCEMLPRFDPETVWERFAAGKTTLFMGVPTLYARLIRAWNDAPPETQARWSAAALRLRLMVSGSAALPVPILDAWRRISGHTLLERYGMTEIGMALSNPLHGERRPGFVGRPLPGVDLRLVDDDSRTVDDDGEPGEIQVRSPSLFLEYWRRPDATRAAFTADGWFRTGDIAVRERGVYRILGRRSIDILKTGGYKVSALEVEHVLAGHPAVRDCAVVGLEDSEWGQRIGAAVVCRDGASVTLDALRAWAREHLAPYKLPTRLLLLDDLPRNAMGKVVKEKLMATGDWPLATGERE